jgi:GH24 family phage-related lysozyme (muramidase)
LSKYSELKRRIKKNEGFRNFVYKDSLGFATIGYGHLIKTKEKLLFKKKLSRKFLLKIFYEDFNKALKDYNMAYKKKNYPKNIREALIEMIYQLGIERQKKFIKMIKYINKNNLFMAALEMKNSLWYIQTPERVDGIINILLKQKNEK